MVWTIYSLFTAESQIWTNHLFLQRIISFEGNIKTTTRSCLAIGTSEQCGTVDGGTTTDCCTGDLCNDDDFENTDDLDTACDNLCNCDCECQDCVGCCNECCNQDLTGKHSSYMFVLDMLPINLILAFNITFLSVYLFIVYPQMFSVISVLGELVQHVMMILLTPLTFPLKTAQIQDIKIDVL